MDKERNSFVEDWLDEAFSIFGTICHFVHHVAEKEDHKDVADVINELANRQKNQLIVVESLLIIVVTYFPDDQTKLVESNKYKI